MKRLDNKQFHEMLNNPNSISKICTQDNGWFFTIDFFATEFSTGVGSNEIKLIKQTWELIDSVSDCFKFMMWGQEPASHNQYVNTLHHEGKNILIGLLDIINLLKRLCFLDINSYQKANFELKNLRNCKGISSFFNTQEQFSLDYINNIKLFNGKKVLLELFFPEYFQFPNNLLKNDFSKVMKIDNYSRENRISLKKLFAGNLTSSPNALIIDNNSNDFPKDYEFESNFELTITQTKGCLQMKYFDKNRENVIELPINSFQLIPPMD